MPGGPAGAGPAKQSDPSMRRLLSFRFLLLLGWLALMPAVPAATAAENHAATAAENQAATAAENHAASSPSASPPPASPWEPSLWHNATTAMRLHVCDHARPPPHWCAGEAETSGVTARHQDGQGGEGGK